MKENKPVDISKLLKDTDSLYKVVRAASKRAKDLTLGEKHLLDTTVSKNCATIALHELAAKKIKIVTEEEAAAAAKEEQEKKKANIFKDDVPKNESKEVKKK